MYKKHHTTNVDTENKQKPDQILFYNATKGGIDTMGKLCHSFTVRRKSNWWLSAFFQNLIDVIWRNFDNERKCDSKRKAFNREIAYELVRPQKPH